MGGACSTNGMGEVNAHRILLRKPQGKSQIGWAIYMCGWIILKWILES
jgi:hypothetical protein